MVKIGGGGSKGGSSDTSYRLIVMAMIIMLMLPMAISIMVPEQEYEDPAESDLAEAYRQMTGANAPTNEQIWGLTGIYTPYLGGTYGYTDDGWLYGERKATYTPSQYAGTAQQYTVGYNSENKLYYYSTATAYGDHAQGDLYTQVCMDVQQQSNIFFTSGSRTEDSSGHFFYSYTGYRYAFQPLANYQAKDADGNVHDVVATTTSLSLIWYSYYGQSGISGQLVLSGSDSGLAYINSAQIISAFSQITSTADFEMVFNGISMNVYIRLDPSQIAAGKSVEDCYNQGYWSIMVTSLSTESDSYTGTDYSLNLEKIWEVIVSLFTFDAAKLGITGIIGTFASLVFMVPLYSALIYFGLEHKWVLLLAGILAAIQALSSLWPF